MYVFKPNRMAFLGLAIYSTPGLGTPFLNSPIGHCPLLEVFNLNLFFGEEAFLFHLASLRDYFVRDLAALMASARIIIADAEARRVRMRS